MLRALTFVVVVVLFVADGPDGKMKNTRKFGFSEYVKSDKKIGNSINLKKSETDIRN